MRENRAKNIIKDTFNKPFDKERFISFLIHFLNEIDIEVNKKYYNKNISSTFNDHIEKYHYLGRYIDEDGKTIDLLSVKLFNKNSLVKARTLQRNFITHFLSNHNSDGALASFYTDESQSWRFSFVKTKYITENNGESWNFKKDYTSAKRYTYLIGKNEPHHTANKRLLKWIQNDKINPTINNILETFSVEKVTDEFYDEYKRLYDILKNNIDTLINNNREVKKEFKIKDISSADFAKKTLGQVVFLYFLQKKGWLGLENPDTWGNGPKNFFDKLFFQEYYKEYKNFFNDILKYLFYEGLAKQHKNNYYDKLKSYFPFLNGGLFEPINNYDWENIEMEIDNEIFEEIINTFNRYNFTVKEDEPLEVEVAVDPEMLGRVFEKLLGTENQKDKGAYYTPREVVHYMCKESIINYLESEFGENIKREALSLLFDINNFEKEENNLISQLINNAVKIDKKLKNIKICDPAIGSGAFPIGLLHVITRARNNLTKLSDELSSEKRSMYNLKRETIQNSLYGVDIESGAIQIAKLRLWLSLVVDEEDANNIKPLPNLDYKIMQGNSLIEEFAGIKFSNFLNKKKKNNSNNLLIEEKSALENKINQIIKLLQQENKYYFNSTTKEEKHNHESRIDKLLNRLFELRIEQENKQYKREYKKIEKKYAGFKKGTKGLKEKQKELGKLNEKYGIKEKEKKLKKYMNSNKKRDFFLWHLYFAEVFLEKGGFDIIMANPPYIKEYTNKGAFDGLRDSKYYQGKMDIWTFFGCKAIDLLKNNGLLCFIATNNWISNYGASIFRNKITNEGKLLSYLDFQNYKVFANADIQTMILFFKKDKNIEGNYDLTYQKVIDDDLSKKELENFFEGQNIDKILSYPVEIESNKNYKNGINFIEKREKKVLDQLEAVSNFNLNNSKVCAGIDVHQDFIKRSHLNDLNKDLLHFSG